MRLRIATLPASAEVPELPAPRDAQEAEMADFDRRLALAMQNAPASR